MTTCPRCKHPVDSTAINCPHCRLELKAHGHAGIPLHRASADTWLCDTCTYHLDDTCTFPQRPTAKTCTLYQNASTITRLTQRPSDIYQIPWWRKYTVWIALGGLILISLMITLL